MAEAAPPGVAVTPLRPPLALYDRYRFDPAGLAGPERERLRVEAEAGLAATRSNASFAARDNRLIAASRRLAPERSRQGSNHTSRTGLRTRVYFDADPAL